MKNGYEIVTEALIEHIQAEIKRTGYGFARALKGNKEAKAKGLNSGILYSWVAGKRARKEHLELARSLWEDIPDKAAQETKKQRNPYQIARETHRNKLLEE